MVRLSPSWTPRFSASRDPMPTFPAPGVRLSRLPASTFPFSVLFARMSGTVMPRTRTASTRPLNVASKGCSIIGVALVTPGVAFACFRMDCQSGSRPP